ncbi:hypothetical protein FACS189487_11350 [Campylobacterota bacterium]|nr:hypothetical protein FACS189487_11350 [Campylobacterota bacterium]
MGAGNVMHAMHDELNIRKMGRLYAAMKPTAIMMTIASVALAGIYPFAGFFSKDKILEVAFGSGHLILWAALLLTAMMTAFYSFRVVMMVFFGKEANYEKLHIHPHEAPKFMLIAISPLAVLAIIAGFFEHFYSELVSKMLSTALPELDHSIAYLLIAVTLTLVCASIAFAVWKYQLKGGFDPKWQENAVFKFLSAEWFIPQLYKKAFVYPYIKASEILWQKMDLKAVDFMVDQVARLTLATSRRLQSMHTGSLSYMLRWMGAGVSILIAIVFIASFFVKGA